MKSFSCELPKNSFGFPQLTNEASVMMALQCLHSCWNWSLSNLVRHSFLVAVRFGFAAASCCGSCAPSNPNQAAHSSRLQNQCMPSNYHLAQCHVQSRHSAMKIKDHAKNLLRIDLSCLQPLVTPLNRSTHAQHESICSLSQPQGDQQDFS